MNILHTVEFYTPSIGGAQEVVRQISERLVRRGHRVTVATTHLSRRNSCKINGVQIEEFKISGNTALGIQGETEHYQEFLRRGDFDIMMNYAAQQWTADLAYPILDQLAYKKLIIPCGFSGLYQPEYRIYFEHMPEVLGRYDHLIFHASNYRDINFVRERGLRHFSIIPNGAAQDEFETHDSAFRQRYGIPEDAPMLLTVGSHTGLKGHSLCMQAFEAIDVESATLVIIGNPVDGHPSLWTRLLRPFLAAIKRGNLRLAVHILRLWLAGFTGSGCLPDCQLRARESNQRNDKKRILLLDPPRADVVSAYTAADLFVFGSNIEYSPLVLFEAMAAQTPFVTLACGNAAEIVRWSGGGVIAPTLQSEHGYVDGDPVEFARAIENLLHQPDERHLLAESGHLAWEAHFTWEKITDQYEALYQKLLSK